MFWVSADKPVCQNPAFIIPVIPKSNDTDPEVLTGIAVYAILWWCASDPPKSEAFEGKKSGAHAVLDELYALTLCI